MLHEPAAAQDVVQDTFARLIVQYRRTDRLSNPRGWLYTVAAHACRDRQRRLGRWLPWIAERDTRIAVETPDRFDDREAVMDAIRALPSRERLLIALRAQGLSYQEIGAAAGIRVHPWVGCWHVRSIACNRNWIARADCPPLESPMSRCLTDDELQALADREAGPDAGAHLEHCQRCTERLATRGPTDRSHRRCRRHQRNPAVLAAPFGRD